jgi:hypothetical protein
LWGGGVFFCFFFILCFFFFFFSFVCEWGGCVFVFLWVCGVCVCVFWGCCVGVGCGGGGGVCCVVLWWLFCVCVSVGGVFVGGLVFLTRVYPTRQSERSARQEGAVASGSAGWRGSTLGLVVMSWAMMARGDTRSRLSSRTRAPKRIPLLDGQAYGPGAPRRFTIWKTVVDPAIQPGRRPWIQCNDGRRGLQQRAGATARRAD